MKRTVLFLLLAAVLLAGCASPADAASQNLSTQADQFKIDRRIVFINGITDQYLLVIEGKCALGNYDVAGEVSVTCKIGVGDDGVGIFKKHFLGLSDNVTYVVEQTDGYAVNDFHYKAIFRPETLIPDIDMQIEEK